MTLNLQEKTSSKEGIFEFYNFVNPPIIPIDTKYCRIEIPLDDFESGLDFDEEITSTEIIFEWIRAEYFERLESNPITDLGEDVEVSIYVGNVHNECQINNVLISKGDSTGFGIKCELEINFESQGVANNESFKFETIIYKSKANFL